MGPAQTANGRKPSDKLQNNKTSAKCGLRRSKIPVGPAQAARDHKDRGTSTVVRERLTSVRRTSVGREPRSTHRDAWKCRSHVVRELTTGSRGGSS